MTCLKRHRFLERGNNMSRKGMEACGEIGILARCEELHMINTGAAEGNRKIAEENMKVLQVVLDNWTDGHPKWDQYDQCVKDLIQTTLSEDKVWKRV